MIKVLRPHFVPFLGLLVLLAVTAGCAWLPLYAFSLPFELLIGIAQTLIIAIYFMEMKAASNLIRLVAFVGIIWLTIFLMLALADYFTRYP